MGVIIRNILMKKFTLSWGLVAVSPIAQDIFTMVKQYS